MKGGSQLQRRNAQAGRYLDKGGSIPAWAGETLAPFDLISPAGVYPRVGGGNATAAGQADIDKGLSPRGRGKLDVGSPLGRPGRSIPAWAGETRGGQGGDY